MIQIGKSIQVFSASQVEKWQYPRRTLVIQIGDTDCFPVAPDGYVAKRGYVFADWTDKDEGSITENQAHDMLKFVRDHWDKVDDIYVHCHMGVSRSPGVCAALTRIFLNTDDMMWWQNYTPNGVVYGTLLSVAMFMGWWAKRDHTELTT